MRAAEDGAKKLRSSAAFKEYLKFQSKFTRYSYQNTLWLMAQSGGQATQVASYNAFKSMGRYVKKGAKALYVMAPVTKMVKDEKEGADKEEAKVRKIVSYRPTPVFDISQTVGKELPQMPIERLEGRVDAYDAIVEAVRYYCSPVSVEFRPIETQENGYYEKDKRIVVDEAMEPNQKLKTLLHECAHMTLRHSTEDSKKSRKRMETEAEAVSFVVLNALCPQIGQEVIGSYSFAYLASWGDDEMTDFKAALKDIQDASSKMIAGIEKQLYVMDMKTSQEMAYEHEVAYLHIKRYDNMYICGIKTKEPEDFAVYTVYGQDRIDEAAVQAMKNAGLPAGSLAERNPADISDDISRYLGERVQRKDYEPVIRQDAPVMRM
jgi:hypothetical protein